MQRTYGKDVGWHCAERLSVVAADGSGGIEPTDIGVGIHRQQDVRHIGLERGEEPVR